jgi:hypothetical protein
LVEIYYRPIAEVIIGIADFVAYDTVADFESTVLYAINGGGQKPCSAESG